MCGQRRLRGRAAVGHDGREPARDAIPAPIWQQGRGVRARLGIVLQAQVVSELVCQDAQAISRLLTLYPPVLPSTGLNVRITEATPVASLAGAATRATRIRLDAVAERRYFVQETVGQVAEAAQVATSAGIVPALRT